MKANFQITKLLILCVTAYILVPKLAALTGIFSTASANAFGATSSNTSIVGKVNSQNIKDIYVPPNCGGPDSNNGSGTR
ncbi:MAG: hypothetical protein V7K97_02475 [Nostoc sp.]|uniref:hypothetical protein n=1 Tax=Nostoc sp. TaxID=1180 RepID=UPI002FF49640